MMGLVVFGVGVVVIRVHGQHQRDRRVDADRAALAGWVVRDAVTVRDNGPGSATAGPSFVLRPLRACVQPHTVHRLRAFMLSADATES